MSEVRVTITNDQKPALVDLVRRLPAILAGRAPDYAGLAKGLKARIGYAILSLVAPNFDELGRGMTGADGDKWQPLSKEYLAYYRRFGPGEQAELKKLAGLDRKHNKGPGDTKGLLDAAQLKLWRKTYAMHLARLWTRLGEHEAKAAAAGIAWNVVKKAGGKTKLDVYGNRQVQILVDTGLLRGSLQPGTINEEGVGANYQKPSAKGGSEQIFDDSMAGRIVVGTQVKYANYHHNGKGRRRRRLWPSVFPAKWWAQILGAAISGLNHIDTLFRAGRV